MGTGFVGAEVLFSREHWVERWGPVKKSKTLGTEDVGPKIDVGFRKSLWIPGPVFHLPHCPEACSRGDSRETHFQYYWLQS